MQLARAGVQLEAERAERANLVALWPHLVALWPHHEAERANLEAKKANLEAERANLEVKSAKREAHSDQILPHLLRRCSPLAHPRRSLGAF